VPVNGADGKHDWTGYLPFDKLPSLYNPPSGIIATANAKITPADIRMSWPRSGSRRIAQSASTKC
jgi:Protein related to penicillin acylase